MLCHLLEELFVFLTRLFVSMHLTFLLTIRDLFPRIRKLVHDPDIVTLAPVSFVTLNVQVQDIHVGLGLPDTGEGFDPAQVHIISLPKEQEVGVSNLVHDARRHVMWRL